MVATATFERVLPDMWTLYHKKSQGYYANKVDGPAGGSIIFFEKKKVGEQFLASLPDRELYKVGKVHSDGGDATGMIPILESALKAGIKNFCCCHSVTPDPKAPRGAMVSMSHRPIRAILASSDDGSHRHGKP